MDKENLEETNSNDYINKSLAYKKDIDKMYTNADINRIYKNILNKKRKITYEDRFNERLFKKLCATDGNYLLEANSILITPELIKISTNHKDPNKNLRYYDGLHAFELNALDDKILKQLCEYDGNILEKIRLERITPELINISMSHKDPNKKYKGISKNRFFLNAPQIKSFIQYDGNLLSYFINMKDLEEKLTKADLEEIIEIAMSNPDENKRFTVEKYEALPTFKINTPYLVKLLIKKDGRFLKFFIDCINLTQDMVDIAMSNPDENKRLSIEELSTVSYLNIHSLDALEELCKYDGNYVQFCHEIIPENILRLAISHKDPTKRLDPTKVCFVLINQVKALCEIDGNYLVSAHPNIINKELIEIASNHKDTTKNFDLQKGLELNPKLAFNSTLMETYILKDLNNIMYAKNGSITPELVEQLKGKKEFITNPKLQEYAIKNVKDIGKVYREELYQEIFNNICEIYSIDKEKLNYHLERAMRINDEILSTLNFEFLQKKYERIYESNGYEKLYILSTYPEVQKQIIEIATSSEDKELNDKRLNLLCDMLHSVEYTKNGDKNLNWIPYYSNIIDSFSNLEFYDNLINTNSSFQSSEIENLTMYVLGKHDYTINTIDDLNHLEQIKNEYIDRIMNTSKNIPSIQNAVLEKNYNLSLNLAKEIYQPYHQMIKESPSFFPKDIIQLFEELEIIIEGNDIQAIKNLINNSKNILSPTDIFNIESKLKRIIIKEYNDALYLPSNHQKYVELEEIPIYLAAGEFGEEEFKLSIHSLGAYSQFDATAENFDYKEDFNRPKIASHGLCTSLIGNNNLGTAIICNAVLGFTNYNEGSLLLGANEDIASSEANLQFNTSAAEMGKGVRIASKYFLPDDMLDWTRHTHNELVFERRIDGNKKRQPSYIVYMCKDFKDAIKSYENGNAKIDLTSNEYNNLIESIKAAKSFNIPIVVVEKSAILLNEKLKIDKNLKEFIALDNKSINRNTIKKYIHDILVSFENNNSGIKYDNVEDINFFSNEEHLQILQKLTSKLKKLPKKELLMAIEELKMFIKNEELKHERKMDSIVLNRLIAVNNVCNELDKTFKMNIGYKLLKGLPRIKSLLFPNTLPRHIKCIFENKILDTSFLMDYKKLDLETKQLNISEIIPILKPVENKLIKEINDIYYRGIYDETNKAHSTRHIEDVMLFAAIIGQHEKLNDYEFNLLMQASKYHDSGRLNDGEDALHGIVSSNIAEQDLGKKYPGIDIIKSAIEYHNANDTLKTLREIANKNGIEQVGDRFETLVKVATILKDADALDRTRFLTSSNAFVDSRKLRYDISKSLIKIGEQINEYYANLDIDKDITNPIIKSKIKNLCNNYSQKEIIRGYRTNMIDIMLVEEQEEVNPINNKINSNF